MSLRDDVRADLMRRFDAARKLRGTRVYQTAPVSNNLILAYLGQHVLGLPRSY